MSKKTVRDIDLKGKKVFVRCDFNVPMDENQNITDNRRIVAALPTIKYLIEQNRMCGTLELRKEIKQLFEPYVRTITFGNLIATDYVALPPKSLFARFNFTRIVESFEKRIEILEEICQKLNQ